MLEIVEVPPEALAETIRRVIAEQESVLELVRDLTEGPASDSSDESLTDTRGLA